MKAGAEREGDVGERKKEIKVMMFCNVQWFCQ